MSPELLDILAVMDLKELNTQLALQCAPNIKMQKRGLSAWLRRE